MTRKTFTLSRIIVISLLGLCALFVLNSLMGVKVNLLWMHYPELDNENIWRNSREFVEIMSQNERTKQQDQQGFKISDEHREMLLQGSEGIHMVELKNIRVESERANIIVSSFKRLRLGEDDMQCDNYLPAEKFDCFPEKNVTKEGCLNRGCCWREDKARRKPFFSADVNVTQTLVDVPYCYYPRNFSSYKVASKRDTKLGFSMGLSGEPPRYYPGGVKHLTVDVSFETDQRLHVKITDTNLMRYEVPLDVPKPTKKATNPAYMVATSDPGQPFWMSVSRTSNNRVVFSTKGTAPLIFSNQFLQLSSLLPSPYIYGLGEHRSDLLLDTNWTRRTLWNHDHPPLEDTNLYGSHPFYLSVELGGQASGFFLLNSNAMDVILQPLPAVTWRTIGGILDFYVFIGESPADVTREYTSVIGRSFMPPYWSLGFHICRFGFKNVSDTMKVVDRVRKAGVPQDTQWNDIDYAIDMMDFTTDTKRFGDQAGMVEELHNRGMKYVIIVDPGISNTQPPGSYRPYDLGEKMDIFIKNETGQLFIGSVWPGPTVFPDFSYQKSFEYWSSLIKEFWNKVPIDGLWIDMNEISSFINGSLDGCKDNQFNNPPYLPAVDKGVLYGNTVCPSARQKSWPHYDLHNVYGLMETNATYQALKALPVGNRPFIISRSTFPGQGHYGGHWTGDDAATYHDMYRSISALLSANLFGIPLMGTDICGFREETTYELCLRWYQLGAFYPFSRSHNSIDCKQDQDPGAFDSSFAAAVKDFYLTRYSLLPYLYTLFYESHKNGTPVARAMFFEFPSHKDTYRIDWQFMWGSGLLIAPVLTEGAKSVDVYLPAESLWYNFFNGETYLGKGANITFPAPLDAVNLLVQGGTILPMQEPALTTTISRLNDFTLLVALSSNGTAHGTLFWDDGSTQESLDKEQYNLISFSVKEQKLLSHVLEMRYVNKMVIGVTVFGVDTQPNTVRMNGVKQEFLYDQKYKVLRVLLFEPEVSLLQEFVMEWS